VFSQLVYEKPGVQLFNHDMWEVATIDWPSDNVTPTLGPNGAQKIIPNYQHPLFVNP
jgi:hypothetical protein